MITRHILFNEIHTTILKQRSTILNFHSSKHAHHAFDKTLHTEINTSMLNSTHKNHKLEALQIFKTQLQLGSSRNVDRVTVSIALKTCRGDPKLGEQVHAFAVSSGFITHVCVSNSLMNMYCKSGLFDEAVCVFDGLGNAADIVSWNTILSGFRDSENALIFALKMNRNGVGFDAVTCTTVVAFCSNYQEFMFGLQLHSMIFKWGLDGEVFVGNALVSMYSRWGSLVEAKTVFYEMPHRDLVSWNAMLSGYTQEGIYGLEAIGVFLEMVREGMRLDHVSFTSAISACGHERNLELAKQIHGLTLKTGYGTHVSVCNVLMSLYSKCEVIGDAKLVFKRMFERNVISWTTMISIDEENVVSLFKEMRLDGVYPNDVTFVGLIHGITNQIMAKEGRMIHGLCVKTSFLSEFNVCNSFITMYAKFESMQDAMKVFEDFSHIEIISWNALISGFAQNGMCQEALATFFSAISKSQPNQYTFGSILSAISTSESISMVHGQLCHSYLIKLGFNTDPVVSGALLDMYAKRGSIEESHRVFNEIPQRSQVTWTTIISAYANHGDYESVMSLFKQMEKDGVKPDSITFISILTACARKGMVDMGRTIFDSMVNDHKIEPSPEIFSCMVDMFGRAGRLKEAEEFVGRIPGVPGLSVMQSLLGSCRIYGNVEMGKRAAGALMEMEPTGSGSYVLLSNLYAENEQWEKVAKIRKRMRDLDVVKKIGFSWVDVGGDGLNMHGFSSSDKSHPRSEEICEMANRLGFEMKFLEINKNFICNITSNTEQILESLSIEN